MKLKDYIKKLNKIAEKHPNLVVCYASDSEGNSFHSVGFGPSLGYFEEQDRHFDSKENFEKGDGQTVNAVCIN